MVEHALNSPNRVIKYRRLRPFRTTEIKVLLLENISSSAVELLKEAGYQVGKSCYWHSMEHRLKYAQSLCQRKSCKRS